MGKKGSRASKEDKEQPQWSEKLIQKAIKWQLLSPSTIKYHMENLTVFNWESDSLFITRLIVSANISAMLNCFTLTHFLE